MRYWTHLEWCVYSRVVQDTTFDRRTVTIPAETTPCFSEDPAERVELTALFDATSKSAHRAARALCATCPFAHGCRDTARAIAATPPASWAGAPSGTWGGELYVKGKRVEK